MANSLEIEYSPENIIEFWYSERVAKQWFNSTQELDQEIRLNYESTWEHASQGDLEPWREYANGSLALAIILDQFPLNMYRGLAKSFETEQEAVNVALHALECNFHREIKKEYLVFLYMPFMHSEVLEMQELSVKLFREKNSPENLRFAEHHRDIIRRFGRFPHRNAILGRESTAAELDYLASKNAFRG